MKRVTEKLAKNYTAERMLNVKEMKLQDLKSKTQNKIVYHLVGETVKERANKKKK